MILEPVLYLLISSTPVSSGEILPPPRTPLEVVQQDTPSDPSPEELDWLQWDSEGNKSPQECQEEPGDDYLSCTPPED